MERVYSYNPGARTGHRAVNFANRFKALQVTCIVYMDYWQPGANSVQRQSWKTLGELWVSKPLECGSFSLQCFDTVGWATGRASGL